METLIAATRNAAELLGLLDVLGTVEEGKLADLVIVSDYGHGLISKDSAKLILSLIHI